MRKLFQQAESFFFFSLILLLPTQLGKHFWPDFSIISGIRVDYLSPIVYVTDILVGILFVLWFLNRHSGKRSASRISYRSNNTDSGVALLPRMTKLYVFFCLFLLINILLSQNIPNGLYHLLKFLEFSFVGYYVATTITSLLQVKRLFLVLGIGVIGQSFLAISQFFKQGALGGIVYFLGERSFTAATPGIANASINGELILRPYGTFPHPNVLAGFLLITLIGLLFIFPWTRKFERAVFITALLLGSSALLLTMSRVAIVLWIFVLVFLIITLIVTSLRTLSKRGVAISYWITSSFILATMVGLVTITFFLTPFGTRLLQTNLGEEAVTQRVELTRVSLELFVQQPLIGVGLGNFLPMLATMQRPLPVGLYLQPVHNIFLLVLVEVGVIGLGFFVWFLVKTYKRLFRNVREGVVFPYRLFVVLLSVILILGSVDHYFLTLQQGQLLFSFILGLSWVSFRGGVGSFVHRAMKFSRKP